MKEFKKELNFFHSNIKSSYECSKERDLDSEVLPSHLSTQSHLDRELEGNTEAHTNTPRLKYTVSQTHWANTHLYIPVP